MSTISVNLPDGSVKELEQGACLADVAASIGSGLAKASLAGKINGELADLSAPVSEGDTIEIITSRSPEGLDIMRHSCAHIMAEAVQLLFPGAQIGFGPQTEDGFFYDFALSRTVSNEDFEAIEAKMAEIIKQDEPFVREVVTREQAREIFADQRLKLEHIYGTAWFNKKDLKAYLTRLEEAEKRDHRKLGRELGIYMMDEAAGVGLPLYLPKGARVNRLMQEWLRKELYRRGYEEVITPHVYKSDVWKTSGHYGYYKENMYFFNINEGTDEEPRLQEYGVKPMNCPGHVILYKNDIHSYRDLPVRYFEFGTVYRHEMSGAVHGLMRARGFTQDDAHVFCTPEQVVDEVCAILDTADFIMNSFGFEYEAEISTRPEKSIGTDDMWELATDALRQALDRRGLPYEINEGDGAFYGPKIDIKVKDALGRTWQCSTIQVDFNLPERFDMTYRTADNSEARPFMLHRALFGSIERFLGILIEHTAGHLPLWLCPVQCAIVPIADRHHDAAKELKAKLEAVGGRVEIYGQNEPMRVKIAKAQQQKIPYMLVLGDQEIANGQVSVRERHEGDLGTMAVEEICKIIEEAQV